MIVFFHEFDNKLFMLQYHFANVLMLSMSDCKNEYVNSATYWNVYHPSPLCHVAICQRV